MQCEAATLGTRTCGSAVGGVTLHVGPQSVGSLYMWVRSRWGHFTCESAVGGVTLHASPLSVGSLYM